jgi:DoxX-like family
VTALATIVTVATALVFLAAAAVKFSEQGHSMETRDRLAIRPAPYRLIGVFEVAGAVGAIAGLAVRPLGIAALTGLVLVGLGACAAQVRLHNSLAEARPAVVATLLAFAALALQIATA